MTRTAPPNQRDERVAQARRLFHDERWDPAAIARELGVKTVTVVRYLDPDYDHVAYLQREQHRRRRVPCPECSRPMTPSSRLCMTCRHEHMRARRERIVSLLQEGASYKEIAQELGISYDFVKADVKVLRDAGELSLWSSNGATPSDP
jgi:DNA-binding transcriptional regulator LsrR (DeoR family)